MEVAAALTAAAVAILAQGGGRMGNFHILDMEFSRIPLLAIASEGVA